MNPARRMMTPAIMILPILLAVMITPAGLNASDKKTEVRFMDMPKLLSAYGFKGGEFSVISNVRIDVDEADETGIGAIEKDTKVLDTPEEFLTAAFYSPVKITYVNPNVVLQELPKGKEGALRLCVMWYKKRIENPDQASISNYMKAIDIVKKNSSLTDSEINEYYNAAIVEEIDKAFTDKLSGYLSSSEISTYSQVIKNYYLNPSFDNYKTMVEFGGKLILSAKNSKSQKEPTIRFFESIEVLNPKFGMAVNKDSIGYSVLNIPNDRILKLFDKYTLEAKNEWMKKDNERKIILAYAN